MRFHAAVFDLDGTLLDTLADIAAAVNRALASLGLPPHQVDDYRLFVGEGIRVLAQRVLPPDRQSDAEVTACLSAINSEYGKGLFGETRPYPGISELLDALVKRKMSLAIVSNKPHDLTLRSVNKLLAGVPFGAVLGERKGVATKPDPAIALEAASQLHVEPAACVYIGDSGIDMQTAKRAGMFPVGALWGFRGKEELVRSGARALIGSPLELIKVIDNPFEGMAGSIGANGDMLKSLMDDKKFEREL
ncbi:MAG TPA: HAD family hydrolase [Chitinivibrionales bacterium]|nr:HAD family hydrolase [Chitinivibrionales bacterium]